MQPIAAITESLGLTPSDWEPYGHYIAKITPPSAPPQPGKLILVTAMTPTPFGEGKTTMSIGLAQGFQKLGQKVSCALREPSLGPVFGMKGGASGGGRARVLPAKEIDLHFTGDLHAITSAHNLLAALIDNHLFQANELELDPRTIAWPRAMDMNDRTLRQMVLGLGGATHGVPRESGFVITAASEIMAILCLSQNEAELADRLGRILIGFNRRKKPVYAHELPGLSSVALLLEQAMKPNLVQSSEGVPVFLHGGPFANIAHGCSSIRATQTARAYSDYTITEAGFATELGAEKFFHIKCRQTGLVPDAVVLVATLRALKYQAGISLEQAMRPGSEALAKGFANLHQHIQNLRLLGYQPVVAINQFADDQDDELSQLMEHCQAVGVNAQISSAFADGGEGALALAETVMAQCEKAPNKVKYLYELEEPIFAKAKKIATAFYGAADIDFAPKVQAKLRRYFQGEEPSLPICIAKTPASLSHNPSLRGAPKDFVVNFTDCEYSRGAGFLVLLSGDVIRMPGLPKEPRAHVLDGASWE